MFQVDDEELINVLQVTKTTAEEVTQKLQVSVQTEKKINIAREEFRAVAARGSILYFLIVEMSNVNVMYQNSLKQFLSIFDNSITKSEKSTNTSERINIILKYLTYEVVEIWGSLVAGDNCCLGLDLHSTEPLRAPQGPFHLDDGDENRSAQRRDHS